MRISLTIIAILFQIRASAQGGWYYETNPINPISGYTTNIPYCGASFVDLNGDDLPDLYAAPKSVFFNQGNGALGPNTPLPFNFQPSTSGSSSADLDNDGDNDLVVSSVPSKVFLNNGSGTFSNVSGSIPGFSNYGSWAVAIGDYNEDANLDFVFAHANGFHPPTTPSPCKFYSLASSSFSAQAITGYPFTTNLSSYTNPYWSDYDLDGDMDLFIASGPVGTASVDPCYKNMKMEWGIDTLVQMTSELFAIQPQDGQCYNFIDYDNDRDFDLCVTNYNGANTRLYKNSSGTYSLVNTPFTNITTNLANCWGDYDNDGDQDVIITNDNQVTKYYRNNGNGTFNYLPNGFSTPTAICSVTNADYDNDGDLDLFANGIGNNGSSNSVGLYLNDTVTGNRNFVNIHLIGTTSNRSAIGAIIKLKATISGSVVWQMREINAQSTFQGQNDLRAHFGLGNAGIIDSLIIIWPSGNTEYRMNYLANTFYKITEGLLITSLNSEGTANCEPRAYKVYPNPSNSNITVETDECNEEVVFYSLNKITGENIINGTLTRGNSNINIENLPTGVYIIRLISGRTSFIQKIIKTN